MKRRTIGIVVAVVVIGVGAFYALGRQTGPGSAESVPVGASAQQTVVVTRGEVAESVSALGTLEPIQSYDLKAKVMEDVDAVPVEEGDSVKAGDVLVRMDVTDLDLNLRQAEADYLSAQARLDDLMAGASESDLLEARTSLEEAELSLQEAERTFARDERLREAGAISEQALLDSRNAAERARQSYVLARDRYEQLQEPPDAADIANAEADLAQAEVRRSIAIEERRSAEVRSPIDGTVVDLPVQVGDTVVESSTVVASVADFSTMQAIVYINEIDIPRVQLGQHVVIHVDALPGQSFAGEVTEMSLRSEVRDNIVTYEVVTDLAEASPGLRSGMTADVEIILEQAEDVLVLPVEALTEENGETFVQRLDGGEVETVPVELGLRSVTHVEVTGGLEEGDEVVIPAPTLGMGFGPGMGPRPF